MHLNRVSEVIINKIRKNEIEKKRTIFFDRKKSTRKGDKAALWRRDINITRSLCAIDASSLPAFIIRL